MQNFSNHSPANFYKRIKIYPELKDNKFWLNAIQTYRKWNSHLNEQILGKERKILCF